MAFINENPLICAKWIYSSSDFGEACPSFSREFSVKKEVKKATIWITAYGVYEAYLSQKRIGDFIMAPGWTSYDTRLQFQEYDVTNLISTENKLEIVVGKGWYAGRISGTDRAKNSVNPSSAICTLLLEFEDGSCEKIFSDESFKASKSKILFSEIYDGEIYDASSRKEEYVCVKCGDFSKENLIPQEGEHVREIQEIKAVDIIKTPKGETVIDFGRMVTGYVRFQISAAAGDVVELSHAEILDKEGNFYTANLRSAKQKIKYICKEGFQSYNPHFTFQGFRYVRLDEFQWEPDVKSFQAVSVHSDMKRIGFFECSNWKVNRLYENILNSQTGNFLDVPTDCPQRDERLGWTGDAMVFARAACYNYDVNRFFVKWLRDLRADQGEDGSVPLNVPKTLDFMPCSSAWGDASVVCPWQLYLSYGNKEILKEQFASMKAWVDFMRRDGKNEYLWDNEREHFGDWLAMDAPSGSYHGMTDKFFIASAFYAYSTSLLVKAGELVGRNMDEYKNLHQNILKAINEKYFDKESMKAETQTKYALMLCFDLDENKKETANKLSDLIVKNGGKITTGFIGTPYLLHALAQNGHAEKAYSLLLQEGFPSWLYAVNKGATTVWEHWDGIRPDGSFWNEEMNSFNHYAYGAVADFMYGVMAGINPDEKQPGYKHIIFKPIANNRLSFVKAGIETDYGIVSSKWAYEGTRIRYSFQVPNGCTAEVQIGEEKFEISKGSHSFLR